MAPRAAQAKAATQPPSRTGREKARTGGGILPFFSPPTTSHVTGPRHDREPHTCGEGGPGVCFRPSDKVLPTDICTLGLPLATPQDHPPVTWVFVHTWYWHGSGRNGTEDSEAQAKRCPCKLNAQADFGNTPTNWHSLGCQSLILSSRHMNNMYNQGAGPPRGHGARAGVQRGRRAEEAGLAEAVNGPSSYSKKKKLTSTQKETHMHSKR